jgi:hypothetical protein
LSLLLSLHESALGSKLSRLGDARLDSALLARVTPPVLAHRAHLAFPAHHGFLELAAQALARVLVFLVPVRGQTPVGHDLPANVSLFVPINLLLHRHRDAEASAVLLFLRVSLRVTRRAGRDVLVVVRNGLPWRVVVVHAARLRLRRASRRGMRFVHAALVLVAAILRGF